MSALVFIPLVPITRVADKNTNTDKRGPLSLQSEHVIKFAAPVVTAGKKGRKEKLLALRSSALLDLCSVPCHQPQSISGKKNSMFLMMLQPGS